MDLHIRNINDLHSEIAKLQEIKHQQKAAIGERFSSPSAIFSTAVSLFPKSAADGIQGSGLLNQDFVGLLSRILLPLALNKTLFRNSNFIVKAIVGLVSQKASHFISEDAVEGLWGKAKSLIAKFSGTKHKKAKNLQGYGIPAA